MGTCTCDPEGPKRVRVSDELLRNHSDHQGKDARLRCRDCGDKAGFIPISALRAFGFDEEDVRESAEPGPKQIYLDLEARWGNLAADLGASGPTPPPDAPTEVGHDIVETNNE